MEEISSISPNDKHNLRLLHESEIRFGPAYYHAYVDGKFIKDRLFGTDYLWSDSSRFLVLLEWRSIDPSVGADIFVFIYDLENGLINSQIHESNGWITLKSIEGSLVIIERKIYKRFRRKKIETIDISQIVNWENISLG